jgi:hypothetical protein
MASSHDFLFNNMSRIGNDNCSTTQSHSINKKHSSYMTNNYNLHRCGMHQPITFATKQPNLFYKGGAGSNVGIGGCAVDDNSKLTIGQISTNPKCRITLQQRPFLTVPLLSKGKPKPTIESALQQGKQVINKKSCNPTTEIPFLREALPLIPSLEETIQNPDYLIEDSVVKGWIRGGLPTRDLVRDQDYFERHVPRN